MSIARTIAEHVGSLPVGSFVRARDFAGARSAVDSALSRLEDSRPEFLRVARGIYWKGGSSPYGPGKPSVVDVAAEAAGKNAGFGPTTWLASNTLKASTQVPAVPEFVVVGRPPERVSEAHFHSRSNLMRTRLSYREIALIEVLRDWPRFTEVSWDDFAEHIESLLADVSIRLEAVSDAVAHERSPAARENFARLVDSIDSERTSAAAA